MASSNSSLVDLGSAAELDDATSKLFFSDNTSAIAAVSWPAATEIESTLTNQYSLAALCHDHGVPGDLTPVCADRLGWRASTPPPVGSNKLCVHAAALDAGLRFPLRGFYARVLRHYRLAPSQLTPNAWSYLAAFVLLCQDAGNLEPMVSAFRYFFNIVAQSHEGKPTGYHHFQINSRRRLFTTGTLRTWNRWRTKYFFLECPSGRKWNCPVNWGKPRREDARRVDLTDALTHKLEQWVKEKGCVDIQSFLADPDRHMPVGDPAVVAPLQSWVKAEAGAGVRAAGGAAGAGAAGATGAGAAATDAAAENASTRKRSRLSPAAVSQPLPTSAPAAGLAPIRPSSTGGRSGHIPPAGFATIRASITGGHSGHFPPSTQQQRMGGSTAAPRELPGMRARAQAVSIGGSSSQVTPPATYASDASLQLLQATVKASEQEAKIAKLNHELHLVKSWNKQWQEELSKQQESWNKQWQVELSKQQEELRAARAEHAELVARLRAANDHNNHLNVELVRRDQLMSYLHTASVEVAQLQEANAQLQDSNAQLMADHAAENAQLKADHAAENAQLKRELASEANRLKEDLAEDAERLRHEGFLMGTSQMRDLALLTYKHKGVISADDLKDEELLVLHQSHQTQGASPLAVEDQ